MCLKHLRQTCCECALYDGKRIRGTEGGSVVMEVPTYPATQQVFRCKG
jgi:hypothetical protein